MIAWGSTINTANAFDVPVPGDYDGDGKFDLAVYRFNINPANTFLVRRSSNPNSPIIQQWGNFQTDYIVPGDYDGDGKFDFVAARTGATGASPLIWWILQSSNNQSRSAQWGISSDIPIQGDYDGDARTDMAVYRPGSPSRHFVFNSFDLTGSIVSWGATGDFATASFDAR
jgi:hypothetical protein